MKISGILLEKVLDKAKEGKCERETESLLIAAQNNAIKTDFNRLIGPEDRVFANCPGDLGSIPVVVIPITLKMILDTSLLNTRQ